jgi:hypothetical protein
VKIIRSGKNRKIKSHAVNCGCGCHFSFTAEDARYVNDQRDGDAYVVKCPECKQVHWVAASLLR